jgi:hypothetical protein
MNEAHILKIAGEIKVQQRQVTATAKLFAEGATVPFIARYRKEATRSLPAERDSASRGTLVASGQAFLLPRLVVVAIVYPVWLGNGIEWPKDVQKKHLHTITQEQVVMRYNENIVIPRFWHLQILFKFVGPPADAGSLL